MLHMLGESVQLHAGPAFGVDNYKRMRAHNHIFPTKQVQHGSKIILQTTTRSILVPATMDDLPLLTLTMVDLLAGA